MTAAAPDCSLCKLCRVMLLTTQQFMKLGGEKWDRGFLIRVGKRARLLHEEILGKVPTKVRSSIKGAYRNKVGLYPCGVLEQAYRQVLAEQAAGLEDKVSEPQAE
ncbi:hypothetical protein [Methylobacterium nigriterrae]|uniref:hypothetical protein n=1 Tax=Methylobacterium nigriterrae TaxID=3127512 RepID=UPI00301336DC